MPASAKPIGGCLAGEPSRGTLLLRFAPSGVWPAASPVLHPARHPPGDPDSRRYFADTIPPNPPGGITAPTNALRQIASVDGSRDPDGQARPAPGERHREDMKPGEERPAGTRRTAKPLYSYLFGWAGGCLSLIEGRHRPVSTERYIHSLSMRSAVLTPFTASVPGRLPENKR